ncbi:hypothetical protein NUU61_001789 [Penicillium alfredii]|uniref:Uncharacterized protein n=1 Tax=Penicillium alfredii TaxID=1506179 RepID=A0A9W9FQD8_9EURO|nr:uncharacterized protein NUU61_001789 [Penicillium alfredii]KAJ5104442.1 hypothetical protein NUU61_001789 [Penicillium alfredii]
MAQASLLFPMICLLVSFAFIVCLYHQSFWKYLQKCLRSTLRLWRRGRFMILRRHRRNQHPGDARQKVAGPSNIVGAFEVHDDELEMPEFHCSSSDTSTTESSSTDPSSEVSLFWSMSDPAEEPGTDVEDDMHTDRGTHHGYTALQYSEDLQNHQTASPASDPSSASQLSTNSPEHQYSALSSQSLLLPAWEQELQHRIQEGRGPSAWLDCMVEWAVQRWQGGMEPDM